MGICDGTILRSLLDDLAPAAVDRIRGLHLAGLSAEGVTRVDVTSTLAIGYRARGGGLATSQGLSGHLVGGGGVSR